MMTGGSLHGLLTAAPATAGSGLYTVIALIALAVPAAVWLILRLYAVISAAVRCPKCRRLSEGERTARCMMAANVLQELEKAGRNIRWAWIAALVLLIVLWLIGTAGDQRVAVDAIGAGALVCAGLIVLTALTRMITAIAVPAGLTCREKMLRALRKNGSGFGWLTAAYALVHLLLTIE